jgi:hypothetical protein
VSANHGTGPLRQVLEAASYENRCGMQDLTVLSPQTDPYRRDTPAGHRDGAWFAEMVERFVGVSGTVHLRGLQPHRSKKRRNALINGRPFSDTSKLKSMPWLRSNPTHCAQSPRNYSSILRREPCITRRTSKAQMEPRSGTTARAHSTYIQAQSSWSWNPVTSCLHGCPRAGLSRQPQSLLPDSVRATLSS